MDLSTRGPWQFDCDGETRTLATAADVADAVRRCRTVPAGTLWISFDDGPRPWWQRFLGASPRYVSGFATITWSDGFAILMFLDDAWSEFRASDPEQPVEPALAIRERLANGEPSPPAPEECMSAERAFDAVLEALGSGSRPRWLRYQQLG